jgi:hypothetical protein
MPTRLLRESILDSDRVCSLTFPAEVFYRRLMSVVDDFGRFDARPSVLRGRLYPLQIDKVREADIERWIAECVKSGLIALYSVSGKQYLLFRRLGEPRAKESKYPTPPAELADANRCSHLKTDANICAQTQTGENISKQTRADVPYSDSDSDSDSDSVLIPTESCTEPPPASAVPPPVLMIPVSGGGDQTDWPVTAQKVAEWSEAYPGVDVLAELRKARQWCIDNPTRRKTLRGVAKFCNSWLDKAQNQTRGEPRGLNGTTIRGPAGTAPATSARRSSGTITQADIDALNARTIRTGPTEPDATKPEDSSAQDPDDPFGLKAGPAGDQSGLPW